LFEFNIVPFYSSADSLFSFDTATDDSIKIMLAGKAFYPNREIMAMHNLQEFGRGNFGRRFFKLLYPKIFRGIFPADYSRDAQ
jgi:hypothetical protein